RTCEVGRRRMPRANARAADDERAAVAQLDEVPSPRQRVAARCERRPSDRDPAPRATAFVEELEELHPDAVAPRRLRQRPNERECGNRDRPGGGHRAGERQQHASDHGHRSSTVAVATTRSATLQIRIAMSTDRRLPTLASPAKTGGAASPKRASEVNDPLPSGSRTISNAAAVHAVGTKRAATTSSST